MKRNRYFRSVLSALLLAMLLLCTACAKGSDQAVELESIAELNSPQYKIGVAQGAASMYHAEKAFPDAELMYFMSNIDAYEAVRTGKIDAYAYDRDIMSFAVAKTSDLELIDEPIDYVDIVVGVGKDKAGLLEEVNAFIARIKADGTYDDMYSRWITYAEEVMPKIPAPSNPRGTLTVGTTGTVEPMSYFDARHELTGFDVEFMTRLAAELGMELKIVELDFTPLLASLETGKIDLAISNLNYSEESTGNVVFSDPYMVSASELMVRKGRFNTSSNRPIEGLEDLKGRKVGILADTVMEEVMAAKVPEAKTVSYRTYPDQIAALRAGRISAMVLDVPVGQYLASANKGLLLLPEKIREDSYAFVLAKDSRLPAEEIDSIIRGFREDGTLDKLAAKWIEGTGGEKELPEISLQGANGTLRFGTYSQIAPFSYKTEDGKIVGYDLELAMRIAEKLGMKLEVVDLDFMEMIPQVQSHSVDLFGSCVTVTEERAALVRFTEPYYEGGISVFVVDPDFKDQGQGFWGGLKKSILNTFVSEDRYRLILSGLGVTVLISVASGVLGSALGFLVCFMRSAKSRWLSLPAKFLIRGVQGMPIILFLMLLYYVVFAAWEIDAVLVAIFGFSVNFSVYVAEMLRSGMDSVDRGQIEAASAMGFGRVRTFVRIVLPQAARFFLPVYKGEFINMVKMTSVVGYIAIQDLTKMSDIIRSRTYEAFFPLIVTAVLYFVIAYVFTLFLSYVEKRIDPKSRRRVVRGVAGGRGGEGKQQQ